VFWNQVQQVLINNISWAAAAAAAAAGFAQCVL
jgi:hypothetical protein